MHSCDWDIERQRASCLHLDYVPTEYTLTLKLEGGGKVIPKLVISPMMGSLK